MLNIVDFTHYVYATVNFRNFMVCNFSRNFSAREVSEYFGCSEDVLLLLLKSKRKSGYIQRVIEDKNTDVTISSIDVLNIKNLHERNFKILKLPERFCLRFFARKTVVK